MVNSVSSRSRSTFFLLPAASLLFSLTLLAQQPAAPPPAAPDPAALAELVNPGPQHSHLARHAGNWIVTLRMGDPAAGGLELKGEAVSRMIVAGRFLEIDYNATSPDLSLEGRYTLAYDRRHNRWLITALDNFGTYPVHAASEPDPASSPASITLLGSDDDPVMKSLGLAKEFAFVYHAADPDRFTIETLFIDTRTPARNRLKAIDVTFTRKP